MASSSGPVCGPTVSAGVVAQARRRHRRRVAATALAVVATGAGAGLAVTALRGAAPALRTVPPTTLLARAPAVGMACLAPRSCDRVGVAVWLRRPAASVTASVAGHSVSLNLASATPFDAAAARARRLFVGYFHWPRLAGVRIFFAAGPPSQWWAADPAHWPTPAVRIRVESSGRIVETLTRVSLQGGWG